MGQLVRIMYVHVPVAIVCFLAFFVTAFGGVMYLWKKSEAWDLLAAASAQIGVLFTALTLITGSIWGKIAWGTWWEWDARLTSTALLFVLFCGYLALRRVITEPIRRARYVGHRRHHRLRRRPDRPLLGRLVARPAPGGRRSPASTRRSTASSCSR